ncbi:MAG: hypothetical protein JWL90_3586 [Chthoniobacteraceae bacterium]|nr:hypothetical protein [Chthoniobacteraceae bacterium]
MKTKPGKLYSTAIGAICVLATPFLSLESVYAADHADSPTLAQDQGADIADVFFFLDPNDNSQAILIATVHGFIVPGEAVNFSIFDPAVRFHFSIENTGDAKADKFIDVSFSKRVADPGPAGKEILQIPAAQTATIKIPKLEGFAGGTFTAPVLNPNLAGAPNTPTATTLKDKNGNDTPIQFFAGEVDDPFFFDIPAFSRFIASIRNGAQDNSLLNRGRDTFGGYNILSIALRIPKALLVGKTKAGAAVNVVGVRFDTQRAAVQSPTSKGEVASHGGFKTVDSMGNPAVNVVLIPFNRKNEYNAAPLVEGDKNKFADDIVTTLKAINPAIDNAHLGILAGLALAHGDYLRLDTTVPNLPADPIGGGAPGQGSGFPNGRRLRDDTVDVLLNVITNGDLNTGDHVDASISQFPQTATFPFLAPAQQPIASADPANPTATDDKTQN